MKRRSSGPDHERRAAVRPGGVGTPSVTLAPPDDALLQAVLLKLFADRQITPLPSLIPWLLKRMDRSFAEAGRLVAALDDRALATGRPLGPKLAGELLDAPEEEG